MDSKTVLGTVFCSTLAIISAPVFSLSPTPPTDDTQKTTNKEDDSVLGAITVTSTRSEAKKTDVPATIDTKDQQEIELDSPTLQKELFNSIAGVRITQTGSTIGHMTSIRMPTNTRAYYLFLQDGIPVQSSGFFNHNGLAYTNYSSAGTTEVLKGAGTALYGSDAIAATVNVVTKKPDGDKPISIKTELGSDDFYRLGVSGNGMLGENADYSVSFSHADSEGWRDHTAYKRDELSITHFYDINDSNTFKTILSANHSDAEMAGSLIGLSALKDNPESVGDIAFALASGLEIKRKFDFLRLSTEWTREVSDTIDLSTIAYLRSNRNRYTATWERNLPHNDSKQKTLGLMFKANINKGKVKYITGIDTEYTKANRTYNQLFDYTPTGFGKPVPTGTIYDYDVNYFAIAPYLRTEYNINNQLQIGVGLRYDINSYDYTNNTDDGQYATSDYFRPDDDNDPTFNHLSPKLDISYKLSDNQLIYGRYANGFRIPQASTLYNLKTNNIDFTLDPETSNTFEVGFKAGSKKHEFGASLYQMMIDDTIVRRENADGDRYYVNGAKTIHKGLELSLASKLSNQFSTKFAFSYSKHEFDNDMEFGNNEQAGAPNDVVNARLFYKPKQLKGLTAMLELAHVGSYWLDDKNTKKYEGYDVGNIKLSYKPNKKLSLFAKVNNITDKIYAETGRISYGKEKYTPAAPRQFFAGLEYSW